MDNFSDPDFCYRQKNSVKEELFKWASEYNHPKFPKIEALDSCVVAFPDGYLNIDTLDITLWDMTVQNSEIPVTEFF
jgi:hypothetical protein